MFNPLYLLYGFLVLGCVGTAEYRGWSTDAMNEVKNVPRSIRDNPGAYRGIYSKHYHYTGGK